MTTFLDEQFPFPYCPGCGHPHVLRALDAALAAADVEPSRIVLVTDIGCVGLADALFPGLHTVHTLHGRGTAVATGLQLGRGGGLKPVVLVGDGGASIGLLHLVHAAQLDVDVTVLVHNNLVYGMTGGQHSALTPQGMATTTTPDGCPAPPLDLHRVLDGAGCTFFARHRAPGRELADAIAEGIRHPGFACIEALELCPSFAAKVGGVTGKTLDAMAVERTGVLTRAPAHPAFAPPAGETPATAAADDPPPPEAAWARLHATRRVLVAGRAGERVQSAAKFVAEAALAAGLYATVRTDNPVTQGKGFSLAELIVAPTRIDYTGMPRPDRILVLAEEGAAAVGRKGLLGGDDAVDVRIDEGLPGLEGVRATRPPYRRRYGPKAAALGALLEIVEEEGWWDEAATEAARRRLPPRIAEDVRTTIARARGAPA